MWELYQMAQAFSQRPSQFLNFSNPTLAYDFDLAVWSFGIHIENQMNAPKTPKEREAQRKRERELRRLLGIKPRSQPIDVNILKQLGQKVSNA